MPARIDQREGGKIWVNATLATAYGHVTASCRTLVVELAAPPAWAAAMYRAGTPARPAGAPREFTQ